MRKIETSLVNEEEEDEVWENGEYGQQRLGPRAPDPCHPTVSQVHTPTGSPTQGLRMLELGTGGTGEPGRILTVTKACSVPAANTVACSAQH